MANETATLKAEVRTETGKGPARRARRAGKVPGVLFGKGFDPVHVDLPGHDVFLIVKDSANAIVEVSYDGEKQLCLVKSVQLHPVSRDILHVDLLVVSKDQKVDVEVPLIIVGEPAPGTQTLQEEFVLPVKAPATAIPEHIEINVEGLGEGTVLRAADIDLPTDVELHQDSDHDVVSIVAISEQASDEPAAASADDAADAE
jgi:ribosomal protein L25, Ctc-form